MRQRFHEKVIVITGAGKGIGRASALAFAREGGAVVVADVSEADGRETVRQISEEGGKAVFVLCDISRSEDVQRLMVETVNAFGAIDILYNNAGVVRYGTVVDMSEEDWDYILNINLTNHMFCSKNIGVLISEWADYYATSFHNFYSGILNCL